MQTTLARIILAAHVIFSVGCVGPAPVADYTLAYAAMNAARASGAPSYAPGIWNKAEDQYRKAESSYRDRYYGEAKSLFKKAKVLAEKSENAARLRKFETGEE